MNYRKKPVVIQAVQFDGENQLAVSSFITGLHAVRPDAIIISTYEGDMQASPGDWIIKGVRGEFYPCKPDIFELTYETAPEPGDLPEVENAVPDWKRRVLNEHAELSDKIDKLHTFLSNGKDHELSEQELDRLCQQRDLMRQYRGVLEARINAFAA